MTKFIIREISNGWILEGPRDREDLGEGRKDIFLSTIHAVADILTTWQAQGFVKAAARANEKYKGGDKECRMVQMKDNIQNVLAKDSSIILTTRVGDVSMTRMPT